jgi:hypothetical protein
MTKVLSNKEIVLARQMVKLMKAKSITPKRELLLVANSIPGTEIVL